MKKLIITALFFFSMFSVQLMDVYAIDCKANVNIKEIDSRDLKKCEGVSDGYTRDIFDYLLLFNKIAFFFSIPLCIFSIYELSTKKEMTKKEEVIASLFVYSPLFSILFFIVIKVIQNLM